MRRPSVFAVLNASPESFSGNRVAADDAADLAEAMVADGADVLDIGAQSLRTDQPELPVEIELDRLLPVLEAVRGRVGPGVTISVDTYRSRVAEEALRRGASIVNDPSGLRDPEMADLVASTRGAGPASIVVAFNPGTPKVRRPRDERLDDPVEACLRFVDERIDRLTRAGVAPGQLILDPGPDLYKAPDESVAVLRAVPRLRSELGIGRVLWAVSRKDFVGALVHRFPSGRDPGTYGALSAIELAPGDIVRVHDVAGVSDFFTVRRALLDGHEGTLDLPEKYRYDP